MEEWECSRLDPEKPPPPPCPEGLLYIWGYFQMLNKRRTSNGFGLNAITNSEMEAWSRLHRITLSIFEVEALEAIEGFYLRTMQPKAKKAK